MSQGTSYTIKDDNIKFTDEEDFTEDEEDAEEDEAIEEDESFEDDELESENDLLILTQEYPINALRMAMMPDCLTMLCRTANGVGHAFVKFDAVGFGLTSMAIIANYVHLRYVDISQNKLKDLSALKSLTQLITLKAQNNILTDVGMTPLEYLQKVDVSNNYLTTSEGLNHPMITHINVNNNRLKNMVGSKLFSLNNLTKLHASDNKINTFLGMECPNLKELHLTNNKLTDLEEIELIPNLEILNLGFNKLKTLGGLANLKKLTHLELRHNKLKHFNKIQELDSLPLLNTLILSGNGVTDVENYRQEMLIMCPGLKRLDDDEFTDIERLEADEVKAERKEEKKVHEGPTEDLMTENMEEEEEEDEEEEDDDEEELVDEDDEKEEGDDDEQEIN